MSLADRAITIIGAPTNIGIKPYDDGTPRGLDMAPAVLRQLGVVDRLGAQDAGDVTPAAYRDFTRTPGHVRNEDAVVTYCRALAGQITAASSSRHFPLVLGGDCSIVLAGLVGVRNGTIGLAYIDGHADFATPVESRTGSAASMCLGMAVGRGDTPLARLAGDVPLVQPADVALVCRRDEAEPWYGHAALHESAVLDIPDTEVRAAGQQATVAAILGRVARPDLHGFWIHVDADAIDPNVMPAVDSPEPGGPNLDEMALLLAPLVHHPKALGMELTIYDPNLDPDRLCGQRLVDLLGRVFDS